MLYYLLFWTLLGFIIHFYIIFGTNLLTGGPAQNCCFCLFQSFAEKEYQTESKRNETFGNVIFRTNVIQRTWTLRQDINQEGTRSGGAPTPLGAPSTLMGPTLLHRRTSSSYIYLRTANQQNHPRKPNSAAATFCTREIPSWGLFRRPVGVGIDHGGLLHQHHSLSDDV